MTEGIHDIGEERAKRGKVEYDPTDDLAVLAAAGEQ